MSGAGTPGGRVLAVDLGSRRIGLALSDPSRTIASPLLVLERSRSAGDDHAAILAVAREREVATIVVGLPLSLSGRAGPAAKAAEAEIGALAEAAGAELAVVAFDERLTTVSAQRSLRAAGVAGRNQRTMVDKVAAAIMLQAFLDREAGA
ncbi:MAG TPA: Holliday junction resolvase RuvX [Acidimicrobiia bacterium]